jgi:parallel beta-helix repeat protein
MRKATRVMILMGLAAGAGLVGAGDALAATLCVNPGGTSGCYSKIQDAINAANPGDLIIVFPGTYPEHLYIVKSNITLQGTHPQTTILDATQCAGPSDNVPCGGQPSVTGGHPGIWMDNVNGVTIRNLTIQNAAEGPGWDCSTVGGGANIQTGIFLNRSDNNTFDRLILRNNGLYEIFLWDGSDGNTVSNSLIDGARPNCPNIHSLDGIFSSGGAVVDGGVDDGFNVGNVFRNNTIRNVVFGVSLVAEQNTSVRNNTIDAKTSPFWNAFGLLSYDVNLFASSNNTVERNILGGAEIGVRMRDPLTGSSYLYAGPPRGNVVRFNRISAIHWGITIRHGIGNRLVDNDISGADTYGIWLLSSSEGASKDNLVIGNRLRSSGTGIFLDGATENTVTRNLSIKNTVDGIRASSGSLANSFVNNIMRFNGEHDAHDESTGGGTAGTANTWVRNMCRTSLPAGLCR